MPNSYFDLLTIKRPTKVDELLSSVRKPKGTIPKNGLPMWNKMVLDAKLPMCKMPKESIVLTREKIGKKLWKTLEGNKFLIYDPNCIEVGYQYDALHDEHLKPFFSRKANRDYMFKLGLITKKGEVICTLKQFNEYRRYLKTLYVLNVEKERNKKNEMKKDDRLFLQAKQFALKDLDQAVKRNIRKEMMKDALEKLAQEARNREHKRFLYAKRYAERVIKLAKRRDEEARQRIVKGRLQDDKIRSRIAIAKELEQQSKIITIRRWQDSELRRQCHKMIQQCEKELKLEKELMEYWENKKQQQLQKLCNNQMVLEKYKANQDIKIALRNKLVQEEQVHLEELLYDIKLRKSSELHKPFPKKTQKALQVALSKAFETTMPSLLEEKHKGLIAASLKTTISALRDKPAVQDVYHVLKGAKKTLERTIEVPAPVNIAIDALLEKAITKYVEKKVSHIMEDIYDKIKETVLTTSEENKTHISKKDAMRSRSRIKSLTLESGHHLALQKRIESAQRVHRGVSFGTVQTVKQIATSSDLQSTKDRPPTPVPSLTDLAEAVFNEPVVMNEIEMDELDTEKNTLKEMFEALHMKLFATVKERTEKSVEAKKKLLYHPTTTTYKVDAIKRMTEAILSHHTADIMNSEEVQDAIDCMIRDLLNSYKKGAQKSRGSVTSSKTQSESKQVLF